jgi:NAD dependent epimerase/dehydratase family enzyme
MCPEASVGMTIAITGSSGLVGSALESRLVAGGHTVVPLRRRNSIASQPLLRHPR